MTAVMRINVLGDFLIHDPAKREVRLPTRKSRALIAYLALHAGKRFTRGHLSTLLWGDQGERKARQSLRQALTAIRGAVGPAAILCDGDYVVLPKGSISSDVQDFEALTKLETLGAAEDAKALYADDLLQGHEFGQPAFDEWLQTERERLKEIARKNLGNILARQFRDHEVDGAIAAANSLIKLDPFNEAAHRTLMRLYARQRRAPAAIRHFQELSALLRREMGISPDEDTVDLYHELCGDRVTSPVLDKLADYVFVLEQIVHCVVVTDASSHIVGWNKAAEAEFGFSKDFMFGQKPTLVYAPKRDQSLSDNVFRLACQHGHWSSRVKLLSKDGRECHQIRTVTPLYDRCGTLIGGFGMGMDMPR
jgi:PAS domain S-box-containing protein